MTILSRLFSPDDTVFFSLISVCPVLRVPCVLPHRHFHLFLIPFIPAGGCYRSLVFRCAYYFVDISEEESEEEEEVRECCGRKGRGIQDPGSYTLLLYSPSPGVGCLAQTRHDISCAVFLYSFVSRTHSLSIFVTAFSWFPVSTFPSACFFSLPL